MLPSRRFILDVRDTYQERMKIETPMDKAVKTSADPYCLRCSTRGGHSLKRQRSYGWKHAIYVSSRCMVDGLRMKPTENASPIPVSGHRQAHGKGHRQGRVPLRGPLLRPTPAALTMALAMKRYPDHIMMLTQALLSGTLQTGVSLASTPASKAVGS